MGFSFAMPFAPYYIQELGIHDPGKLKLWISFFAAATPLALAIFAPVWGLLADRYGRRLMLLRANFSAVFVLLCMGWVQNVESLVILRFIQGMLTGTVTAAQAMVAAQTPQHRSGFALGSLSSAVFSGVMVGALLGGIFSDCAGYRNAFLFSSTFLFIAGLLILLGTKESVNEMKIGLPISDERPKLSWPQLGPALPILILLILMGVVRQFDMAMVPLLVQEICGRLEGVSLWMGGLFAVSSVAGLLSGLIIGPLADRLPPHRIIPVLLLGAGICVIPQGMASSFMTLYTARFGMVFCSGGLDPILQVWLARATPENRRGFIFGWAATARSMGWMMAPLLSGLIATHLGVRAIYVFNAIFFILLIPLVLKITKK